MPKFIKDNAQKAEKKYRVQEVSQAIGVSESTISGHINTKQKKSVKGGLTLDDIVSVIERPRVRGSGIDFVEVAEIRRRLVAEKGYRWVAEDSNDLSWFDQLEESNAD